MLDPAEFVARTRTSYRVSGSRFDITEGEVVSLAEE